MPDAPLLLQPHRRYKTFQHDNIIRGHDIGTEPEAQAEGKKWEDEDDDDDDATQKQQGIPTRCGPHGSICTKSGCWLE